jgi:hypothetical protein
MIQPDWQDDPVAIKHYLRAINYVVNPLPGASSHEKSMDVALMTCVLFICFEVSWNEV